MTDDNVDVLPKPKDVENISATEADRFTLKAIADLKPEKIKEQAIKDERLFRSLMDS